MKNNEVPLNQPAFAAYISQLLYNVLGYRIFRFAVTDHNNISIYLVRPICLFVQPRRPGQFFPIVFEFSLTSTIICICRLFAIICSPYKVLEVLKQSVYFLKVVEFCPTFDIQIDTSAIFRGKVFRNFTLFRNPTEVSQNKPTFILIGPPITK